MRIFYFLGAAQRCAPNYPMIKTVIKIDGMMCPMCESHVNDVVRKNCDAKKVSSSHKKGETEIISEKEVDIAALTKGIEATGYKVLASSSEPYEKKGFWAKLFG